MGGDGIAANKEGEKEKKRKGKGRKGKEEGD